MGMPTFRASVAFVGMPVEQSRPPRTGPVSTGTRPLIITDLTGDLPCIGCGYNLKGLSIRSLCPECGVAIRATILARVDPMAEELRPIRHPVLVAHGMIVWAWAAIAAACFVWAQRLTDVLGVWFITPRHLEWVNNATLAAIAVSGIAALALVRPVSNRGGWEIFKAMGACLAYLPLLYIHHQLHVRYDGIVGVPFIGPDGMDDGRSLFRLGENLLIAVIILGLRDNAVSLAERSIVMRTGRVDTQPLVALVGSLALASLGDVLHLVLGGIGGVPGDLLLTFSLVIIAVGSFLFTLGLIGIGVDVVRLRPVLLKPSPGLTDVIAGKDEA